MSWRRQGIRKSTFSSMIPQIRALYSSGTAVQMLPTCSAVRPAAHTLWTSITASSTTVMPLPQVHSGGGTWTDFPDPWSRKARPYRGHRSVPTQVGLLVLFQCRVRRPAAGDRRDPLLRACATTVVPRALAARTPPPNCDAGSCSPAVRGGVVNPARRNPLPSCMTGIGRHGGSSPSGDGRVR